MESRRDVTGESGCLFTRVIPGGRGAGPPSSARPRRWVAFVAQRIPEIFMLAHPEWIPAMPWALASWVRGSFKLTGNCETKEQAVPEDKCLIAL